MVEHQPNKVWLQDTLEFWIPARPAKFVQLFGAGDKVKLTMTPRLVNGMGRSAW